MADSSMTSEEIDRTAAKLYLALKRSLDSRHELLPYLKDIIIDKFKQELDNITEDEVNEVLVQYEQAKEPRDT